MGKKIKIKNEVKTGKYMTFYSYEDEENPTIDAPDYYPLGCAVEVEEEGLYPRVMQAVGCRNHLM